MSKFEVDSDGFQVVKSKNSAKNKHTKLPNKDIKFEKRDIEINIEQSIRYNWFHILKCNVVWFEVMFSFLILYFSGALTQLSKIYRAQTI